MPRIQLPPVEPVMSISDKKDKPRVEPCSTYAATSSLARTFTDLADAQRRVEYWCTVTAGLRIHGTTYQRPAEHFVADEQRLLLPAPTGRYDVPIFATSKVARDVHIEVACGLYSIPAELVGQRVDVRGDSALVKVFHRGSWSRPTPG